jgi:hypothetical protein
MILILIRMFVMTIIIIIIIIGSTVLVLDLGLFSNFLILYTFGRILGVQSLYLHIGQHKQNKHTHICMVRTGFEPTAQIF